MPCEQSSADAFLPRRCNDLGAKLLTTHLSTCVPYVCVGYLDRLGLLAAYFAAMVHDHGHPGLTNDFLIATGDVLAVRYNDKSPLENHHAASAFALLQRHDLDLLGHLPQQDRAAFRKQVRVGGCNYQPKLNQTKPN